MKLRRASSREERRSAGRHALRRFFIRGVFSLSEAACRNCFAGLAAILLQAKSFRDGKPRFRRTEVYIDLSDVVKPDASTVLYLGALVHHLSCNGVSLRGNTPRDLEARRLFSECGFKKFMESGPGRERVEWAANGLAMRALPTAAKLSTERWLPLHKLLAGSCGAEASDLLYAALSECIENVRQHAYPGGMKGTKWYALARRQEHDVDAPRITVAIADIGATIPGSLAAAFTDPLVAAAELQVLMLTETIASGNVIPANKELGELATAVKDAVACPDWWRVWLALMGFRTETMMTERGTGLDFLRTTTALVPNAVLHVHSASAHVCYVADTLLPPVDLPPLLGTVVTVELW